jgi:cell division septal protein FtsQ
MEKKMKKVRKIKVIPLIITISTIIVIFGVYYLLSLFPITNIYVKGNEYLDDWNIIKEAGISNYPSYINTSTNKIKKKLNKNPYIKKVKVTKKFFGTIVIKVEEKNALFRKLDDNKLVFEDGNEIDDNNDNIEVPILLNYVPDTKYKTFIEKMNLVDKSIKLNISEIRYYPNTQDEDRFLLHMNDGNYVYLTLTKFKQINYYEEVLDQLDGKKGILYLDSGNHFKIMES